MRGGQSRVSFLSIFALVEEYIPIELILSQIHPLSIKGSKDMAVRYLQNSGVELMIVGGHIILMASVMEVNLNKRMMAFAHFFF